MAFTVEKKLNLTYLGGGWANGTYLTFTGMTFTETREFAKLNVGEGDPASDKNLDLVLSLLRKHFIAGKGYNGKEVVDITVEDLPELPVDVITKSIELLAGANDPKS